MACTLNTRRNLNALKKEARELLHELRRMDPKAMQRYSCHDPLAGDCRPRLDDARYVVARQYGFKGWQELKQRMLFAGLCVGGRGKSIQSDDRNRNET